ncbi:MAG: hypothetical protein KAR39_02820 [Thermoplasmata archaeon]|nr:hypothetical protein [Thermoplasmata archaeon]
MNCPSCNSTHLDPTTPGTKVYDFQCDSCEERYQLKAKSTKFGRKLTDSAYGPLKDAIEHDMAPSFFFLRYTRDAWKVLDLEMGPSLFPVGLDAPEALRCPKWERNLHRDWLPWIRSDDESYFFLSCSQIEVVAYPCFIWWK